MAWVPWHDVAQDKLNYSPYQTRYCGAAKCTPHGVTKHVGRVHESGIEVLLTIRHIMLHTVRIQFFRAHELVHTFDGNSCLEKLHCMYILIHVTKCITKQHLSKNSFSLAFESNHIRSTLHQHPTS